MAFLDLLKHRARAGGSPGLPDPMLIPADPPPELVDYGGAAGRRPSPMQRIADRLEQRIADDFALFNCWLGARPPPPPGPAVPPPPPPPAPQAPPPPPPGRLPRAPPA